MIRDRLKGAAKKALIRAFGMEWQSSDRPDDPARWKNADFDPNVIPRVVDGSGDTPGPNHKTNIGRTWLAAQVASDVAPFLIDIRPPRECAAGVIKGALVMPGDQVKRRLDRLPPKEVRVTVYDQLGSGDADALAAWLRGQGWDLARRLVGGYAEWIEHGEPIEVPQAPPGGRFLVGQMVEQRGGARGWVQQAWAEPDGPRYLVWQEDGSTFGPLREDELAP
jgi:rhodanese-related sulfurtransferase